MRGLTIWKATLEEAHPVQEVQVPQGSEFLTAGGQHDRVCVWFRCDPAAPPTKRKLAIVCTGQSAPASDGRYLGTAFLFGGDLVLHVFEESPALSNQEQPE